MRRYRNHLTGIMFPVFAWSPAHGQTAGDGAFARSLAESGRSPWTFQASGVVTHFREPRCQSCEYRTSVPGVGLERELPGDASSSVRYSLAGGLQSDSFGRSGGYAAAVASRLFRGESIAIKPGIGGFAFYRYMDGGGERELVPAILPVLGIEGLRSGLGATVLVAPNFSYGGSSHSGFVFLQLTYRLGR